MNNNNNKDNKPKITIAGLKNALKSKEVRQEIVKGGKEIFKALTDLRDTFDVTK